MWVVGDAGIRLRELCGGEVVSAGEKEGNILRKHRYRCGREREQERAAWIPPPPPPLRPSDPGRRVPALKGMDREISFTHLLGELCHVHEAIAVLSSHGFVEGAGGTGGAEGESQGWERSRAGELDGAGENCRGCISHQTEWI